ncbi:acyl carrier protein [bacterium]|nr:acyl carrier protein [bacterium]
MTKYSKEAIYEKISQILESDFEISKELIKPESKIFEDLDLDSIDAVDLAVRLQQFTQKKISPADFKDIKTLNDVVDACYNLLDEE